MKKIFAVSVLSLSLLGLRAAHADPAADKLFADAHAARVKAHADREAAWKRIQEAVNDEIAADALEHTANFEDAKALGILKADAKRIKAFHDRVQAMHDERAAHRDFVEARNLRARAAAHSHTAAELRAAEKDVPQAELKKALEDDAKRQDADAKRLDGEAKGKADAGHKLVDEARKLLAEAAALDPAAHKAAVPAVAHAEPLPPPAAATPNK